MKARLVRAISLKPKVDTLVYPMIDWPMMNGMIHGKELHPQNDGHHGDDLLHHPTRHAVVHLPLVRHARHTLDHALHRLPVQSHDHHRDQSLEL